MKFKNAKKVVDYIYSTYNTNDIDLSEKLRFNNVSEFESTINSNSLSVERVTSTFPGFNIDRFELVNEEHASQEATYEANIYINLNQSQLDDLLEYLAHSEIDFEELNINKK